MHEEPEPYNPELYNSITDDTQGADRLNSEETDEEFDWFVPETMTDDTYFTFVNKNRKTFEAGD